MQRFTDIHSHIIPGVDDGAKDMEQTIQILTIAYQEGIRGMFATPHYEMGRKNTNVETLQKKYQDVVQAAKAIADDFEIYLGNEIMYEPGVIEDIREGKALTLHGTRYILVEFLPGVSYPELRNSINQCVQSAYIPIIAHAERYQCLVKKPSYVEELVNAGAYIQINISHIKGGIFNQVAKFCKALFDARMVHFLGTDTHNIRERGPYAKETLDLLAKRYGASELKRIIYENPMKMLENKYI